MNYRHIYHAGNACDVVKHAALTLLVERLREKEKGFAVLDTHAGAGLYDLDDERAQKTGEAEAGIRRLLAAPPIPELSGYYKIIQELNQKKEEPLSPCGRGSKNLALHRNALDFAGEGLASLCTPSAFAEATADKPLTPDPVPAKAGIKGGGLDAIRFYPGSPVLIRRLLRPQDRLMAGELHPEEARSLKRLFRDDKQTQIHHRDGTEALKALVPPAEKRGLVLIDPPFEKPDEFETLAQALKTLHERWPQGQAVLWYPVKDRPAIWRFHESLAALGIPGLLCAEFTQFAEIRHDRLNGCGLIIVNPPWRFSDQLEQLFPALHRALRSGESGTEIKGLAVDEASR